MTTKRKRLWPQARLRCAISRVSAYSRKAALLPGPTNVTFPLSVPVRRWRWVDDATAVVAVQSLASASDIKAAATGIRLLIPQQYSAPPPTLSYRVGRRGAAARTPDRESCWLGQNGIRASADFVADRMLARGAVRENCWMERGASYGRGAAAHWTRVVAVVGAVMIAAMSWGVAGSLSAALRWSRPQAMTGHARVGEWEVSCVSATRCVAVGGEGATGTLSGPLAAPKRWIASGGGGELMDVSCPAVGWCLGVSELPSGVMSIARPASHGHLSWRRMSRQDVSAVSCASVDLCAASSDTGKLLVSITPTHGARSWKEQDVNFGQDCSLGSCLEVGGTFEDVSCVNIGEGLCVAVGDGELAASSKPTGGRTAWPITAVDPGHSFTGVSCTTTGLCAAVDDAGHIALSTRPLRGSQAWHVITIDRHRRLTDVACAGRHLCAAIDNDGDVLTSSDPGARRPAWRIARVDVYPLTSITCTTTATCLMVDDHGRVVYGKAK